MRILLLQENLDIATFFKNVADVALEGAIDMAHVRSIPEMERLLNSGGEMSRGYDYIVLDANAPSTDIAGGAKTGFRISRGGAERCLNAISKNAGTKKTPVIFWTDATERVLPAGAERISLLGNHYNIHFLMVKIVTTLQAAAPQPPATSRTRTKKPLVTATVA